MIATRKSVGGLPLGCCGLVRDTMTHPDPGFRILKMGDLFYCEDVIFRLQKYVHYCFVYKRK